MNVIKGQKEHKSLTDLNLTPPFNTKISPISEVLPQYFWEEEYEARVVYCNRKSLITGTMYK